MMVIQTMPVLIVLSSENTDSRSRSFPGANSNKHFDYHQVISSNNCYFLDGQYFKKYCVLFIYRGFIVLESVFCILSVSLLPSFGVTKSFPPTCNVRLVDKIRTEGTGEDKDMRTKLFLLRMFRQIAGREKNTYSFSLPVHLDTFIQE